MDMVTIWLCIIILQLTAAAREFRQFDLLLCHWPRVPETRSSDGKLLSPRCVLRVLLVAPSADHYRDRWLAGQDFSEMSYISDRCDVVCLWCDVAVCTEHVVRKTPDADWSACSAAERTWPARGGAAPATCQYSPTRYFFVFCQSLLSRILFPSSDYADASIESCHFSESTKKTALVSVYSQFFKIPFTVGTLLVGDWKHWLQ